VCCFSGPVVHVGRTRLFARAAGERQLLAYGMDVAARSPVAMILPLPVPAGSGEDALRFVDLSGYARLFDDMGAGFPDVYVPDELEPSRGRVRQQERTILQVHEVGAFVASFVPRLADFARLDRRFRLSDAVWRALPQYADWGFAVFALKDLGGGWFRRARPRTIHPMAFEFPRRDASALFFPTVHVHAEAVHAEAVFDHTFYYQSVTALGSGFDRRAVSQTAERGAQTFVEVGRTAGLVDGSLPIHRLMVRGVHPNRDTLLA
jgi:hypothetical protein